MSARIVRLKSSQQTVMLTSCEVCGGPAPFGEGMDSKRGLPGLWYCGEHRPADAPSVPMKHEETARTPEK